MKNKHPLMYCDTCGAERKCSISKPHFCLTCGNYVDYLKHKGEKLVIDKRTITQRIDRIKTLRADSFFPRDFQAGMLYAYLTVLDEEPDLENTSEVLDWMDKIFEKKRK